MIYDHFKKSKTEGAIVDISNLMDLELVGNNLRAFDTAWDDLLLGIDKKYDEDILESLYLKQIKKSDELSNVLALYNQDIVIKGEKRNYEKLRSLVRAFL